MMGSNVRTINIEHAPVNVAICIQSQMQPTQNLIDQAFLIHRRMRPYTVSHRPYRSGMSRHGEPELRIQNIPLKARSTCRALVCRPTIHRVP